MRLVVLLLCLLPHTSHSTFEIEYSHLVRNASDEVLRDVRIYLPVPADDEVQRISDLVFQPDEGEPLVDRYGQQIRRFFIAELQPGEEITVGFRAEVRFTRPRRARPITRKLGTRDEIPEDIAALYTTDAEGTYDLESSGLRERANELTEGAATLLDEVRAIHDHVADARIYSYAREDGWDGAAEVLARGSGSCSELTFLFTALCRARGIPTRFVGGSIAGAGAEFPHEDRVWHRWAEVYLPGHGWFPVDVTLDRGEPASSRHFGVRAERTLVTSRGGGGHLLGKSYIGANTHGDTLSRERVFVWR